MENQPKKGAKRKAPSKNKTTATKTKKAKK
jgi:hypothetical protein